jgi:hypothetical protein
MATPRKTPMKAPAPKPEKKRAPAKKAPAPKGAKKPARTLKSKASQALAPVVAIKEDAPTADDHDLSRLSVHAARSSTCTSPRTRWGRATSRRGFAVKSLVVAQAVGSRTLSLVKS